MADQHADRGDGEPAPPSPAAQQEHAAAPRAPGHGQEVRAPLGEWRGPVFWMGCGALLAGLAVGAVMLVQRVGVERDMMAVAATLPAVLPRPATPAAPAAAAQPVAGEVSGTAPAAVVAQPSASPSRARLAAQEFKRSAKAPGRRHGVGGPSSMAGKPHAKPGAGRQRLAAADKYAEVFRRCPARGKPGAVRCRRDICNGAEGKGPACKPYVRKLP